MVRLARDLERAVRRVRSRRSRIGEAGCIGRGDERSASPRAICWPCWKNTGASASRSVTAASQSPLRADIEEFHRNGFALLEQQKQRQISASTPAGMP